MVEQPWMDDWTAGGVHVEIDVDPYMTLTPLVHLDGERQRVVNVSRVRDGGTTTLYLGNEPGKSWILTCPRQLGSTDRTPVLKERVKR